MESSQLHLWFFIVVVMKLFEPKCIFYSDDCYHRSGVQYNLQTHNSLATSYIFIQKTHSSSSNVAIIAKYVVHISRVEISQLSTSYFYRWYIRKERYPVYCSLIKREIYVQRCVGVNTARLDHSWGLFELPWPLLNHYIYLSDNFYIFVSNTCFFESIIRDDRIYSLT